MTEARRNTLFLLFAALVVLSAPDLAAANLPGEVEQGITAYQDGLYTEALRSFRSVLTDSRLEDYQDDAYFWIGKTYLAQGDYDEATRHLEYFLSSFPDSPLRPEGLYQKGRLLYLQREFESAIQILYSFIQDYPRDVYIANAYFWIGESLYSIGHLEEAEEVFRFIDEKYPSSYKIEAARFRLQLIQFKHRENELVKLLKISHEEYLRAVEEFIQREKAYEQALSEYQKRLAVVLSEDLQEELDRLTARVKEQQITISELEEQNRLLRNQAGDTAPVGETSASRISPTDTDVIRELLDMKAEALELKEYYLGLIERSGQ
ncbi:tetratricopeptide repeat protein [Marispirochaeta aestuarii]|uniref:tetratricopeptide repeat protein n=1 Tax=Marispirochaeta aestuarii TaxID=1963862 RepID=UPI0029C815F6|nr:tetratricopeptide repeat protein [Marispirochaeta aestuarii]